MNMKTILASAALAMTAATGALAEKTKVGFVYVGPVGDGGWTYEHDQGRKAVVEAFGDKVETMYVENVPEGPDAERVMTDMALKGADLIFTTSFGYMDPTINVAAKFPNVSSNMPQVTSKLTTSLFILRAFMKAVRFRAILRAK